MIELGVLCHIGTMDPDQKGLGVWSSSWEGHGLSVSLHPERWEEIARLGGLPWFKLTNPAGHFLDYHRLAPPQRETIAAWAVAEGLAERVTAWQASWTDTDTDEPTGLLLETREDALSELEALELDATPEPVSVLKPTSALEARVGSSHLDCLAHATVCYVEDTTELAGVWWADVHGHWSAPRGVILPGKLAAWAAEQIPRGSFDPDTEDERALLAETIAEEWGVSETDAGRLIGELGVDPWPTEAQITETAARLGITLDPC